MRASQFNCYNSNQRMHTTVLQSRHCNTTAVLLARLQAAQSTPMSLPKTHRYAIFTWQIELCTEYSNCSSLVFWVPVCLYIVTSTVLCTCAGSKCNNTANTVPFLGNVHKYGKSRQATGDNITRRMRIACRIIKATSTFSEYVILISFHRNNVCMNAQSSCFIRTVHCLSVCLVGR